MVRGIVGGQLKMACQLQMAQPDTKVTEGCESPFSRPSRGLNPSFSDIFDFYPDNIALVILSG